ncbi:DUF2790 domain-containing protein [Pseudomonas putida]|uniref:DUF2790 domain-containing protein n=1 Tax=Pseudomonas putida TaxID=303 RepID=A0A7Y7Z870_PSEPU|nr:DUF2790 domain-containing protein [Pseudomonas putida]NWC78974.1 DUF2790 domain-containing protein [Pseudomonas putida]
MKNLIVAAALAFVSMASQATNFSEQKQLSYLQEHQDAVARYAEKNGKLMPEIKDYKYGVQIDVAKFVRQSQDPRNCQVYPRLMTFEDSQGKLNTVRYSMYAQCINNK